MHQALLWETVVNKQTTAAALMELTPGTPLLHINDRNAKVLWSPLCKETSESYYSRYRQLLQNTGAPSKHTDDQQILAARLDKCPRI